MSKASLTISFGGPEAAMGAFLSPESMTVQNNLPIFPDFVAELTLTCNKLLSTLTTVSGSGHFWTRMERRRSVWSAFHLWRHPWLLIWPWPITTVSVAPLNSHPSILVYLPCRWTEVRVWQNMK